MRIQSVAVGAYGTNCYLIEQEGHWMVVDPGDGRNAVLKYLQKEGIRPEKIAVTHGHMDHFADAAEMAETYQIPIYILRYFRPLRKRFPIGAYMWRKEIESSWIRWSFRSSFCRDTVMPGCACMRKARESYSPAISSFIGASDGQICTGATEKTF